MNELMTLLDSYQETLIFVAVVSLGNFFIMYLLIVNFLLRRQIKKDTVTKAELRARLVKSLKLQEVAEMHRNTFELDC
jgi:hypothetical protein